MKKFRKIMAVLVAAMMIMAMMVPAWAAGKSREDTTFTITIDNAITDETYSAYKVFDSTYDLSQSVTAPYPATDGNVPGNPDTSNLHQAYAYTISTTSLFYDDFLLYPSMTTQPDGYTFTNFGIRFVETSTANVYNVIPTGAGHPTSDEMKVMAAYLATKTTAKTPSDSKTANTQTYDHTDYHTGALELDVTADGAGYYFVTTTTGAFCSLDTTENTATVREKNSIPTLTKKVSKTSGSGYTDQVVADIGDIVYYQMTITDGAGTNQDIIVHDVMNKGLTLDISSFSVADNDEDTIAADEAKYSIVYKDDSTVPVSGNAAAKVYKADASHTMLDDSCSFEITFDKEYVSKLGQNKVITITYSARLNKDAVIAGTGTPNSGKLNYAAQESNEKIAKVFTYAGALYKYAKLASSGRELADAVFTMLPASGTPAMYFEIMNVGSSSSPALFRYDSSLEEADVNDTTSYVAGKFTNRLITPESGVIIIYGLETGNYNLTETNAPDGYRKLTEAVPLSIEAASTSLAVDKVFDADKNIKFLKGTDDKVGDVTYQMTANSITGVENVTDNELPSTGGMGTTVLYIVGGMLVILAGAYLFFSRKKTA